MRSAIAALLLAMTVGLAQAQPVTVSDSLPPAPAELVSPDNRIPIYSTEEAIPKPAQNSEDALVGYTYWLMWFTGALVVATLLLVFVAFVQIVYFARKERAFIFQKTIDVQFIETPAGAVREWAFAVAWENSGGTPTRDMRYRVTHDLRDTPLPLGHQFADKPDEKDCFAVLGPTGTISCLPIYVHVVDIQQVQERRKHLYIWGWAEYRTAFWLSRLHKSKFCIEIVAQPLSEGRARIGMPLHGEHNTAD